MKQNKFKKYLDYRGLSKAQAAEEIGCSRQYVYMLIDDYPAGKRMATRIEEWSEGFVPAVELMQLDKLKSKINATEQQ